MNEVSHLRPGKTPRRSEELPAVDQHRWLSSIKVVSRTARRTAGINHESSATSWSQSCSPEHLRGQLSAGRHSAGGDPFPALRRHSKSRKRLLVTHCGLPSSSLDAYWCGSNGRTDRLTRNGLAHCPVKSAVLENAIFRALRRGALSTGADSPAIIVSSFFEITAVVLAITAFPFSFIVP